MQFRSRFLNSLLAVSLGMGLLSCQTKSTVTPAQPSPQPTVQTEPTASPTPVVEAIQPETAPTDLPLPQPSPTPVMEAPRNVVFIVVDSLRADHLSSYGYSRQTTPNLDRWMINEGVRFEMAVPSASWTGPSNAALMTGKTPSILNATFETLTSSLQNQHTTLAEYLDDAGFFTAGFVNNPCLAGRFGYDQGFDYYDDVFLKRKDISTSNKVRGDEVNSVVMDWMNNYWVNEKGEKPRLFLFLYYMEPHVWLAPPAPFNTMFDPDYTGPLTPEIFGTGEAAVKGALSVTERDIQHQTALYDGEIASWDANFSQLMTYFDEIGLSKDTLFILTGDHGEFLGEYGLWVHAFGMQQEVLHVPLLMKYPGAIPAGTSVASTVQTFDIMPTILDWVGVPLKDEIKAQSIRSLAQGVIPGDSASPGRPAFSEINGIVDTGHWAYWQAPRENLYSVYQDGWRYIYHADQLASDELYQLNSSSLYQTENLLAAEPGRAEAMKALILEYFALNP